MFEVQSSMLAFSCYSLANLLRLADKLRRMAKIHRSLLLAVFLTAFSSLTARAAAPLFIPAPGPPITVARGSGPVLVGDVNHDGHLDLITKHLTNRAVTVLFGDGRGHFSAPLGGPLKL